MRPASARGGDRQQPVPLTPLLRVEIRPRDRLGLHVPAHGGFEREGDHLPAHPGAAFVGEGFPGQLLERGELVGEAIDELLARCVERIADRVLDLVSPVGHPFERGGLRLLGIERQHGLAGGGIAQLDDGIAAAAVHDLDGVAAGLALDLLGQDLAVLRRLGAGYDRGGGGRRCDGDGRRDGRGLVGVIGRLVATREAGGEPGRPRRGQHGAAGRTSGARRGRYGVRFHRFLPP